MLGTINSLDHFNLNNELSLNNKDKCLNLLRLGKSTSVKFKKILEPAETSHASLEARLHLYFLNFQQMISSFLVYNAGR